MGLDPEGGPIRAVIFDFDGTLTHPGALDFDRLRGELGCPPATPLLEFIAAIADPARAAAAREALERFEMAAAAASRPNAGAEEAVRWLHGKGLRLAVISRNSRSAILRALENFDLLSAGSFDLILSREAPAAPKPSPEGVALAIRHLGVRPGETLVVGDFAFDILAGRHAGARTVFLDSGRWPAPPESDFVISGLAELVSLVHMRLPLPPGKLPNALLDRMLESLAFDDPALLINPGIGEDIAAVDVAAEEVLILKSDPITFATDAIGHYAVLVNANDIATSGAVPRWLLTTLLFPPGVTPLHVRQVVEDLSRVCRRWGITLCGGHTEISDAVNRPVVAGTMAGTVSRRRLIDKRAMRPGDRILITKGLAVEGTAIIAREFAERLRREGVAAERIAACRELLDSIGILEEARIAADSPGVSAMHDVTEGGLAAALPELGIAGGHRLQVLLERIPVLPETRAICPPLGIDPLGLIGSGSLLICCRPGHCAALSERLTRAGIAVAEIGSVLEAGRGLEALEGGRPAVWPQFAADEITRLF
jgi:HAD superfamily hydrolase (TIGR01509 family)